MRSRSVASTLLTFAAGVAASAVARRFTARRRAAHAVVPAAAPLPAPAAPTSEAVVLPFTRQAAPAPVETAAPTRCGDNGGRTKAGAPCAARATAEGRCHHHRLAA